MYITVQDPWGSYVDGRPIEHKDLVEAFAKSKGFTTQETDKEPVIDLLTSPIKTYEEAMKKVTKKEVVSKAEKSMDKGMVKEFSKKDKMIKKTVTKKKK